MLEYWRQSHSKLSGSCTQTASAALIAPFTPVKVSLEKPLTIHPITLEIRQNSAQSEEPLPTPYPQDPAMQPRAGGSSNQRHRRGLSAG